MDPGGIQPGFRHPKKKSFFFLQCERSHAILNSEGEDGPHREQTRKTENENESLYSNQHGTRWNVRRSNASQHSGTSGIPDGAFRTPPAGCATRCFVRAINLRPLQRRNRANPMRKTRRHQAVMGVWESSQLCTLNQSHAERRGQLFFEFFSCNASARMLN